MTHPETNTSFMPASLAALPAWLANHDNLKGVLGYWID